MYEVRPLVPRQFLAAARIFGRGFADDPAWEVMGPRGRFHRLVVCTVFHFVEIVIAWARGGWVLAANDGRELVGAMVAYPRGEAAPPAWIFVPRALPWLIAGPLPTWRSIRLAADVDKQRPREPHVYCWLLVARPGKPGAGMLLMRAMIDRSNAEGRPMYLEATAPHLAGLYGALGFDVTHTYRMPNDKPLTMMWRPVGGRTLRRPPAAVVAQ